MAEDEGNDGKQGDLKYYTNQPYDLEVDINHEEEEPVEANTKQAHKAMVADEAQDEQNYQEIASSAPQIKELPKFDLSKFEDLPASPEAKELLTIMKR